MGTSLKIWLLGLVTVLIAACAAVWQKPQVSVVDIEFLGGNIVRQDLRIAVKVSNKNAFDIALERLNVDLMVDDKRFAQGRIAHAERIPAHGEKVFDVQARIQLLSLLTHFPQWIGSDGMLHYQLRGQGKIQGYGEISFNHPGTLNLDRLRHAL